MMGERRCPQPRQSRGAPSRIDAMPGIRVSGWPRGVRVRASARAARRCWRRRCAGRGPRGCKTRWMCRKGKLAEGLEALGLTSVGALLEHLPRDSREARTVAALKAGEQATVAVQVRRIAARAVRRRGMKPLVEATVFDVTGNDARDVLQPAVAGAALRAGDAAGAARQDDRAGDVQRRSPRGRRGLDAHRPADASSAPTPGEADALGEIAHYPATEGVSSTQILALVQGARGALADVPEALSAATRVSEGLPDRGSALAAMHFPRDARGSRGGPRAAGVRGAAVDAAGVPATARAAAGEHGRRPRLGEPAGAERALAEGGAAVRADGRPARAVETIRRRAGERRARCRGC